MLRCLTILVSMGLNQGKARFRLFCLQSAPILFIPLVLFLLLGASLVSLLIFILFILLITAAFLLAFRFPPDFCQFGFVVLVEAVMVEVALRVAFPHLVKGVHIELPGEGCTCRTKEE